MTWPTVELAELADVLRGVTYKREQARESPKDGHLPLLRATNIGTALEVDKGLVYVPESVVRDSQRLQVDDIVLASSSGSVSVVGKSARLTREWQGTFGAFCAVLRANSRVLPAYLGHYIQSHEVRKRWSDAARGTNINNLKRGDLMGTPVPLPPLDEQRRIVDLLDDHLSRLDAADRLLRAQGDRLAGLEALLAHDFTTGAGERVSLASIARLITDGDHNPPKRVPAGVPHVTAKGIRPDGSIDLHSGTFISEDGFQQTARRYLPTYGDIIVTCVGTIGRVALVPPGVRFSADRNLAAVRVDEQKARPDFIALALKGTGIQHQLRRASGSTAQPHLYLKDLRATTVQLPSLSVQSERVAEADAQIGAARRLRGETEHSARRSIVLRRSLLAAAFSGRLTAAPVDLSDAEEMIGT